MSDSLYVSVPSLKVDTGQSADIEFTVSSLIRVHRVYCYSNWLSFRGNQLFKYPQVDSDDSVSLV